MTTKKRKRGENLSLAAKPTAQEAFLASFAKRGIVSLACQDAGISRTTFYGWKADPAFLARYEEALEDAKDTIRAEIVRRAIENESDLLLMFHAKAIMPEYRDKQHVEYSGNVTIKTEWGGGSLEAEEDEA